MDRTIYVVQWSEEQGSWQVLVAQSREVAVGAEEGPKGVVDEARTRREAVKLGAKYAREDEPSQLLVRNKGNGRWSEERTYPRSSDPVRWPG